MLTYLRMQTSSFSAFSGTLKLDVSPASPEVKYSLTPELYKIDPYPDDKGRAIKEIVEFPSYEIYEPHQIYRLVCLFFFEKSYHQILP